MQHDLPRTVQDAASVLLRACLSAGREDASVREALRTVAAHITEALAEPKGASGRGHGGDEGAHGVLTPPGRRRQGETGRSAGGEGVDEGKRIAEPLAVVVTRARWKAAACRLALTRHENLSAPAEQREDLEAQAASREKSLRSRLSALPDTSAWMLDFPFGKRVSDADAFDVDGNAAKKLSHIADCYETVATGAEIAMDLDESGVFRGGPPAAFLYLLAEAQSALLHSLHEAPTRIDSDQRDVFLWLKEQTTRYRIYVDRHMRLDDPADIEGSADLLERLRRAAREAQEERNARRERGQILSKVRYHVSKLVGGPEPLSSEAASLENALGRWKAGNYEPRAQRMLVEALRPLEERLGSIEDHGVKDDLLHMLSEAGFPSASLGALTQTQGESGESDHVVTPMTPARKKSAAKKVAGPEAEGTAAKERQLIEEVAPLLDGKRVLLFCEEGAEVDSAVLKEVLGPKDLEVLVLRTDTSEDERWEGLEERLSSDAVELLLLGVRLPAEEYQRFKSICLEEKKPFVRLPGSFSPAAIAHQVSRQVGWRLRDRADRGADPERSSAGDSGAPGKNVTG